MKHLTYLLLIASCLVLITSCKTHKQLSEQTNTTSNQVTYIHDKLTPVALKTDSAQLKAMFECDSNYNVVLKELFEVKSRNIQAAFDWHDGLFSYRLRTGGDTVYIPSIDQYYSIIKTNNITRTVTITKTVTTEKKLSWAQKRLIASGRIFNLALVSIILYLIIRFALKYFGKRFVV